MKKLREPPVKEDGKGPKPKGKVDAKTKGRADHGRKKTKSK